MNLQEQVENLTNKSEFTADDRKVFESFKEVLQQSKMPFSDLISFALHRLVAIRLHSNPNLIQKAKANLKKWLNQNPKTDAWLEWKQILENEDLENVLEIITAKTDEGQRLRSSSPFVGIITKEERREIIKICEKARPV